MKKHVCLYTICMLIYCSLWQKPFNVLLQALLYIFSKFSMVWGYLQRVTTRYRQIFKKNINNFFEKMMLTRGNGFQIAQNQASLRENIWSRVW